MSQSMQNIEKLEDYMTHVGRQARHAARLLSAIGHEQKRQALTLMAGQLRANASDILTANSKDIAKAAERGLSPAMIDRLTLDMGRIEAIAESVESIAAQDDPVGATLEEWTQPNGLQFRKVSVPIGVIGIIYESRPNVTADAAALSLKSGNAVILRGGSEAVHSNHAILEAIHAALAKSDVPADAVQLVGTQDRKAVGHMLAGLSGGVDLIIPRGGKGLVARVQSEARVPVLAHLDGLNHTYVHASAKADMALDIVANAKMRRTGVCGATETVLVDDDIAKAFIPALVARMAELDCEVRGDASAQGAADGIVAASEADFDTEHLAPILNLAIVNGLEDALAHIDRHSSGHTDAIVAQDAEAARQFLASVDSAIVLHNASTQFADGGEFGFGAEIGIATGRLHARGPVGAKHLTTHKYQVVGSGTLRP
ncbi:MAG: glutamate-5-semialdehyde dehydrogenase [Pseudomonadota bacterium]